VTTPKRARSENLLLAALSAADRRRLMAGAESVELVAADILAEPGERVQHVFFPTDGCVSLAAPVGADVSLEVGLIGNEGMLGASLVLGVDTAPLRALVQSPGRAWRLERKSFNRTLECSPSLRRELGRYVHVLVSELALTATCSRFHVVEARLARRLLMTRDRADSGKFHITHEALAGILGARREGVTQAAGALQRRGIIRYHRGNVEIVDARGLEAAACGCYAMARKIHARALR
jgi:CRP-like cAMP-binding protein